MNGQTLKYLADVADLAKLEIEASGVMLAAEEGTITAGYSGAYARGSRSAPFNDVPFALSISASRFKAIAAMFPDDEEIKCRYVNDGLRLVGNSISATLRTWGEMRDFPVLDTKKVKLAARLPTTDLISEIEAAAGFVSDSAARPALQGIRLNFYPGSLHVYAFDGAGALYRSTIACRTQGEGSVIVPTQDFLLGARLLADEDAVIVVPNDGTDAVAMYNKHALFRSSVLTGVWPDISGITMNRKAASAFDVEAATVRNLVAGAKAFESGPDILVGPAGNVPGKVRFRVSSESGAFAVTVKGSLMTDLRYDAITLGKAGRIGSVLSLAIPASPSEPTLIKSEHRSCWVVTRI
jgi:DNA polymerase III sliding clamp (beta) subunit (PCNA family)